MRHQSLASSGFSLIEILIVVGILGILLGIALPAYTEYVAKGQRANATSTLLQAQHYRERFYLENRTYVNPDFANRFGNIPATGTTHYNVTLNASATYVLTMTRANPGPMNGDRCGNFTLDNFGRRAVINFDASRWYGPASATQARAYCWPGGG